MKNICDLIFKLVLDIIENNIFVQHLLVVERQHTILAKLQNGLMHLIQATKFQQLNDGHEMCLKCLRNFFNHSDVAQKI
jgi:hypothetical protein